jgi:hypothetical protein
MPLVGDERIEAEVKSEPLTLTSHLPRRLNLTAT